MNDIVERLRRLPPSPIAFGDSEADKRNRAEREEAADEIERLRADLSKYGDHTYECDQKEVMGRCSCGYSHALGLDE